LKSEILDLQKETQQIEQTLNPVIYVGTQPVAVKHPSFTKTDKSVALLECLGFLKCLKPEECSSYELCLNKYMRAEIRNENIKL
jgi:hypothetical protein